LAEGFTNATIAERLCISARTVESHLRQVQERLDLDRLSGMNRRVQLARLVLVPPARNESVL
jgi:DNA-binding NarL/FixJ family response regulator